MTESHDEQPHANAGKRDESRHGTPISGLLVQLSHQFTGLIREEIALAKADAKEKIALKGKAIAMFAVAGVIGLFTVPVILATLILVGAIWLPAWASALILTGVLLLVIGGFVLLGIRGMKKDPTAGDPGLGERIKTDVDVLKGGGDDDE